MGKLTALQVKAAKTAGRYMDGDGLMLVVKPSGSRAWTLRMQVNGRRRDFGLGSSSVVGLLEAREKALETRRQYRAGIDPIQARKASQRASEPIQTFKQVAEKVFDERKSDWVNPKHRAQWLSTMQTYVFPYIGSTKVEDVSAADIRTLLLNIWQTKPETARRVLQRVALTLDWAFSNGLRTSEAPVRTIRAGLAKQTKRPEHFASLPYQEVPALMKSLEAEATAGRLALRFLILTAARSGEVRGATWSEIDLNAALWTIPAARMKAKREHVVPLSRRTVAVLKCAKALRTRTEDEPVFPGLKGKPLSDATLTKVLRSATSGKWTVHGFRSSFRDWAAECSEFPAEVAEAALAHTISDKVVAAYRRTDYLEKRKTMMEEWAALVGSSPTVAGVPMSRS